VTTELRSAEVRGQGSGVRDRRLAGAGRLAYLQRIGLAYLFPVKSHLTFWHDRPEVNPDCTTSKLGPYYLTFSGKADFPGHYDCNGIPMLDYHGRVGLQYNPIAVAQYGLGNFNQFRLTRHPERRRKFLLVADWLVANLERNPKGLSVWNHHFDWEYRTPLKAPWYSALAQGQGLSVLVRAHQETGDRRYERAAYRVMETFLATISEGGVTWIDRAGDVWFEEAIVDPPTHILNGFIWAGWGLYDFLLHTGDQAAGKLFTDAVRTLGRNLHRFDSGYWSLYELSGTKMKMLASPFYHRLHLAQLQVMHKLTGEPVFAEYFQRWHRYERNPLNRTAALAHKSLFKLLYY
jgi:heparosan-N-sulfate-glucuronate 5-epimerase